MLRQYDSHMAYRIHRKISCQFHESSTATLKAKLFSKHTACTIVKNLFPYKEDVDYKHYCVWINPKYSRFWNESRIKVAACAFAESNKLQIYRLWRNSPEYRSVHDVNHWHLLLI